MDRFPSCVPKRGAYGRIMLYEAGLRRTVWTDISIFVAGLGALYLGAEWLVRGSGRLARSFGMSALLVGLTIVALGTSTPELVVSSFASARDVGDLAFGNVLGSNVVNIALILGLAALLYPLRVQARLIHREIPIMLAATAVLSLVVFDGGVARIDGILLLAAFGLYIGYAISVARRDSRQLEKEFEAYEEAEALTPDGHTIPADLGLIVIGIGGLGIGAELMVESATGFARALGVSELVIGLTIVSIGTSLPELATVLVAAFREEADIALGNAVGSNIFNILAILGVAAVIRPIGIAPSTLRFELPALVLISVLLFPFAWTRLRLDRWEGAVLIACYIAFTLALFLRTTPVELVGLAF